MQDRLSPLELLHPHGHAPGRVVLGDAPPLHLFSPAASTDGLVDVVVVARRRGARTSGDIEPALARAIAQLSDAGIAYVLAPPYPRVRAVRALRGAGLEVAGAVLHLPDLQSSRYLIPLGGPAARFALDRLVPARAWRRALARRLLGHRLAASVLRRVLPSVGVLLCRPEGPRPLAWLSEAAGVAAPLDRVVLTTSHHGPASTIAVHVLDATGRPAIVAKLALDSAERSAPARQAAGLREHGGAARAAGATVPEAVEASFPDGRPLLLESAVGGRSAASVLAGSGESLAQVLDPLAEWIARWNAATAEAVPLTPALLRDRVLEPADVVVPHLSGGREYLRRLSAHCERLQGSVVPLVATHNDLTMWNVQLVDRGRIGVVDWETARTASLPLGDAYYAVADAVAAVDWYRNRAAAFDECFSGEPGRLPAAEAVRRVRSAVEVSDEIAELCFHACWLHHAANDVRAGDTLGSSFLEIASRLPARQLR